MEIRPCPVVHPTAAEFSNFYEYIHHLDHTYKQDYGMVKIVPPSSWKPQAHNYHRRLQNLEVKHPIQQNVQGRGGFYQSKNIVQAKMSLKAYRRYAERESQKAASLDTNQKEAMFWKTITYSAPIYGADLTGSLMDENAGPWNLNCLDSLLRYCLTQRVKGVTEPYCYIGSWKAFFSWHKEDLDLSALNYIHEGASKVWYSIAKDDSHILQNEARQHFKAQATQCSEFLRHKTFLIKPELLLERHPSLKISKIEHRAGEIMIVFGGAYHSGFNLGFNIAQAVNYATIDWLGELPSIRFCKCFRKNVKGEIESILYNLENSSLYPQICQTPLFQNLQLYVLENQAQEEQEATYKINPSTKNEAAQPQQGQEFLDKSSLPKASASLKIKKKSKTSRIPKGSAGTGKKNKKQAILIHQQLKKQSNGDGEGRVSDAELPA